MRNLIFILLINIQSAFGAEISGWLSAGDTSKKVTLTLINYDTRNDSVVKTANVDKNKYFRFELKPKDSGVYSLSSIKNKTLLHLVIQANDQIKMDFREDKITVSGSVATQYLVDYEEIRLKIYNKWLKPVYDSSAVAEKKGDKEKLEFWNKQQTNAMTQYKAELSKWASQDFFINSQAAIHHSLRWNADTDIPLMDAILSAYKKNYPEWSYTVQLENKVIRTKRIALGVEAPRFSSTTSEGINYELVQTKARYILLDFWASWCPPCRQESPTLVRLYKEYKTKGFEIVGISIDDNKEKWIKAVEKDQYTWTNISDLKGWKSPVATLYNIGTIPSSFLLDESGKIIAKNLRGKELEDKLKELLH